MSSGLVAVVVLPAALALLRWLRVMQREHYLAPACSVTVLRWARRRPPNGVLASVALLSAIACLVASVLHREDVAAGAAVLTWAILAMFPWGMRPVGRPPLRWTRRARTLAAVSVVLGLVSAALLTFLVGVFAASAAVVVATPIIVDIAAALLAPLERRALERHRRAAARRLAAVDPFVVAVTGSWGKTSTKNHIRDLVAGSADVVASPASWNNTAGLSRTMNEHLTDSTEVLVVEMGMYGPGEIRQLCGWVRPNIAVICAIGPMHLERVGSIEGIVAAKAEILERADTAVLWVDEPRLASLPVPPDVKVWRVGRRGGENLRVEVEVEGGTLAVWADGVLIGRCEAGDLHAGNVGCAVAAALAYGVRPEHIGERLGRLANPQHRATAATTEEGVVVIDDTFNSNPQGARAAVDTIGRLVPGRRVVITPGMVELGPLQHEENRELARAVVESGATLVVVGWTNRRALLEGSGGQAVVVGDRTAARAWVRGQLGAGDGVLWENDLPDHYP